MADLERVQARLDNIRTIEPILGALRTISLGNWQAALKRRPPVRDYIEQLGTRLVLLAPHVPAGRFRRAEKDSPGLWVAAVVGSERGLCGRFNVAIVEQAERYLADRQADDSPEDEERVELQALGAQADRILRRRGHGPDRTIGLAAATLPSLGTARHLIDRWLRRYEAGEIEGVDVIYNTYRGPGRYDPLVVRIIPPPPPAPEEPPAWHPVWGPPIIETDPRSLHALATIQWTVVKLYEVLLESAAAEHAARYQLLETASQNAERLIEELTLAVQTGRQRKITQEMQELAAGAGLLE